MSPFSLGSAGLCVRCITALSSVVLFLWLCLYHMRNVHSIEKLLFSYSHGKEEQNSQNKFLLIMGRIKTVQSPSSQKIEPLLQCCLINHTNIVKRVQFGGAIAVILSVYFMAV